MPIYEYRRPDGTTFEIQQAFTDDPLTKDPDTGVPVTRVLHAPAVHFKGSGFYNTDYGTRKRQRELAAANGSSGESKGDSDGASASGDSSSADSSAAKNGSSGAASSSATSSSEGKAQGGGKSESKPKGDAPAKGPANSKQRRPAPKR